MTEREKIQKAFNQCSDALMSLEQKSILKVFHLLSVHFDIVHQSNDDQTQVTEKDSTPKVTYLPARNDVDDLEDNFDETKRVNKRSTNSKKGKTSSSNNLTYLSDFDFMPSGKESLKEFFCKYKTESNMEANLIFLYYLQEVLETKEISSEHIYSCYRHLGLKIPSFPQTLRDTKSRKGWIETSISNDLKVTRAGINYLEHDMPRNNGE
jgi:hypothetical protein